MTLDLIEILKEHPYVTKLEYCQDIISTLQITPILWNNQTIWALYESNNKHTIVNEFNVNPTIIM